MIVFEGLPDIFIGTFGQPVTIIPTVGVPVTVTGIFTDRPIDELGIVQPGSVLHVRTSDAPAVRDGSLAQVGDRWFEVRSSRPDGKGMTAIRMEAKNGPL